MLRGFDGRITLLTRARACALARAVPGNVRQGVEKLLSATKLDEFFSETAETVNGRAAMLGFLGFTIVATII